MQNVGQALVLISSHLSLNFNSFSRHFCYVFLQVYLYIGEKKGCVAAATAVSNSNAVLFDCVLNTRRANGSQSWVTDLPTDIITRFQLRPVSSNLPTNEEQPNTYTIPKATLLLSFFLEYPFWPLLPREMNR